MILVVTCTFDKTADYIIAKLKNDYFRLNVDTFDSYGISYNGNGWSISNGDTEISSSVVQSIYYRKPYLPDLSNYEVKYRGMIADDIIYLIKGLVAASECKKLTCPYVLQKAENKLFQMVVARHAGFLMAKTLFTNCNKQATAFAIENVAVIKPISTGKIICGNSYEVYNTSLVRHTEFDIGLTPIFLQKYIEKDYEARVYIVGEKDFSVKIKAFNNVDWRLDESNNYYEKMDLPIDIRKRCLLYMKEMNLFFGAFDFIVCQGDWYFLENNPNGQWLWLEQKLNLGISDEIINYLEG